MRYLVHILSKNVQRFYLKVRQFLLAAAFADSGLDLELTNPGVHGRWHTCSVCKPIEIGFVLKYLAVQGRFLSVINTSKVYALHTKHNSECFHNHKKRKC